LIYRHPKTLTEYRQNVTQLFKIFHALKIDLYFTVDEFINFQDTDFYLLQLFKVYCKFVDARCALPPATDGVAGITADRNGDPVVVNLLFADDDPETFRTKKDRIVDSSVVVGDGSKQSVVAPPVCMDEATVHPHLPAGLVAAMGFEQPRSTVEEMQLKNVRLVEHDDGILLHKDNRRGSFFKLSAASHFVMARAPAENPGVYIDEVNGGVPQVDSEGLMKMTEDVQQGIEQALKRLDDEKGEMNLEMQEKER